MNFPTDHDEHPQDRSLRRFVSGPPSSSARFVECDEESEGIEGACEGCPAWGIECFAWYREKT